MCRNNHQYKVGDKILVKCKKNSKHKLEFMGPLSIAQINEYGMVRFQNLIINDATNIIRIKKILRLNTLTIKRVFTTQLFLFKQITQKDFS